MTFNVNDFLNRPLSKEDYVSDLTTLSDCDNSTTSKDSTSILVFEVGNSLLGIKTTSISSILTNPHISQIPFITKRDQIGFISYSGYAVPVLDIAAILGLNISNKVDRAVIFAFEELFTAFVPDRILGVEKLHLTENDSSIQNPLLLGKSYFQNRVLSIINIEQLARLILNRSV